jgi:hypothetical protein
MWYSEDYYEGLELFTDNNLDNLNWEYYNLGGNDIEPGDADTNYEKDRGFRYYIQMKFEERLDNLESDAENKRREDNIKHKFIW